MAGFFVLFGWFLLPVPPLLASAVGKKILKEWFTLANAC
jgi:hypothetical protein